MELQNVVIVDGARSAFTRGGRGAFTATRLDDVGVQVLQGLLSRNPQVAPEMIEDVGMGCVGGVAELAGIGANHIVRLAGLPESVCTFDSNRQCGSSMETMHRVAQEIMVGAIDVGIALGVERMGRQLGGGGGAEPDRITEFNSKRHEMNEQQRNLSHDHGLDFSVPIPDAILDSSPVCSMLQTAQNVAEMYDLSRETLDEFAVESHRKYGEATAAGFYKGEIVPIEVEVPVFDDEGNLLLDERGEKKVVEIDEGYRPGTNFEGLSGLRTVRGAVSHQQEEIRITAGNSCPTNDGFTAALLMSERKAEELGLRPLARLIGFGVGGVKPQIMGMGPVPATRKALAHAGVDAGEIDRVEFNEAFAAQVIPSVKEIGLNPDAVNVNGGSLAIGHPLGATGTRLVTTVARELQRSGTKYGLATQCIGAGMGISTVLEAV